MTSTRPLRMRLAFLATLFVASCTVTAAWGAGAVLDVNLDRAKIIRMPDEIETIVVGNPMIADVATLKGHGLVVITGKGFGETNMIFLDKTGKAVEETTVRVEAATSLLTVQRGLDRESWACHPRCEPTVSLGDASNFLHDGSGQITSRNSLMVPGQQH